MTTTGTGFTPSETAFYERFVQYLRERHPKLAAYLSDGADPHAPPPGHQRAMQYMLAHPGMSYQAAVQHVGGR